MADFEYMCEQIARKIFQCGRFGDPFVRLANTDSWGHLLEDGACDTERICMVWAIISRLRVEYLDSRVGRETLSDQSDILKERALNATTNSELREIMIAIDDIVQSLGIKENPHLSYRNTNDTI